MSRIPALADFRRIVVKVGSSLLVDASAGGVKQDWLASLAADIGKLHGEKRDVLVVSSGAIALGRAMLKLPRGPLRLEDSQAAAAVGQIALARTWAEALGRFGISAGQVLVTLGDTEERRRYLNARSTIGKLLEWRAVPVINENDTVATSEIRYGDNDRLAARVATMASADLLVLLSDIDGLYDAPPNEKSDAKLIPLVERITPEIEGVAGAAGSELHLVPDTGQSRDLAQALDRGLARAEGHADIGRRRRDGTARRQEPAAGGRAAYRWGVRARRRRDPARARRRRDRPRPGRL
jgi:glutamate 5-kinase